MSRKFDLKTLIAAQDENLEAAGGAPDWLCQEGVEEWNRVVRLLNKLGVTKAIDEALLATYCSVFGSWKRASLCLQTQELVSETRTGTRANPLVRIALDYASELRRLAAEFGFTPASRARLKKANTEEDGVDPAFKEFMDNG